MIEKVKLALRITTNAFDSQITQLINSALKDLEIAGVVNPRDEFRPFTSSTNNELIITAVTTYVRAHFGTPSNYSDLKASYDEQKAQLSMSSGSTKWTTTIS